MAVAVRVTVEVGLGALVVGAGVADVDFVGVGVFDCFVEVGVGDFEPVGVAVV